MLYVRWPLSCSDAEVRFSDRDWKNHDRKKFDEITPVSLQSHVFTCCKDTSMAALSWSRKSVQYLRISGRANTHRTLATMALMQYQSNLRKRQSTLCNLQDLCQSKKYWTKFKSRKHSLARDAAIHSESMRNLAGIARLRVTRITNSTWDYRVVQGWHDLTLNVRRQQMTLVLRRQNLPGPDFEERQGQTGQKQGRDRWKAAL